MAQITYKTDPPKSGRENMDIDSACLRQAEESSHSMTVVRFYQWTTATVSLGKHQTPEKACNIDFCRLHDIPVVHRPTGGRAVLHDNELTYSVVSNDPNLFPMDDLMATYHVISRALQHGFLAFGIPLEAAAGSRESNGFRKAGMQSPCFSSPTRHELLSGGRKMAGSAQRRLRRSFLQHGSIPLAVDYHFMADALGNTPLLLQSQMIGVEEVIEKPYELTA